MEEAQRHWLRFSLVFFGAFILSLFFYTNALAATLYAAPSSGTHKLNSTFSVGVYVSTPDGVAINAYSGTMSFPEDKLQVVGISKSGITSLWAQEPSYSNANGSVSFEGIVLNPGFNGSGGTVLTLTFKVIDVGSAPVTFTSSSALANDGSGTNVLSGVGGGNYTLVPSEDTSEPDEPTITPAVSGIPGTPVVTSSTHADSNVWYSNANPEFQWSVPSGTTGVNVLATQNATEDPGTTSDGIFSSQEYTDVDDGVWYFHIRFRNSKGWGPAAHYKFQVDTLAPAKPSVEFFDAAEHQSPQPRIALSSPNDAEGIAFYKMSIDGGEAIQVTVDELQNQDWYKLSRLEPGSHTLTITAYDLAGNASEAVTADFSVDEPTGVDLHLPEASTLWLVALSAIVLSILLTLIVVLPRMGSYHTPQSGGKAQKRLADLQQELKALRSKNAEQQRAIRNLSRRLSLVQKIAKHVGDPGDE